MRTDQQVTKKAFELMKKDFNDIERVRGELLNIMLNDPITYSMIHNKRNKPHTAPFCSLIVLINKYLVGSDYYASNPQIKKFCGEFYGVDYRALLFPLVEYVNNERKGA